MATQGSIMTAALPCGCGLSALLLHLWLLMTVRLPRVVMRQDILLRLAVQYVPIVSRAVDWLYPVTRRIDYFNPGGSTFPAARDQHRHQAYG